MIKEDYISFDTAKLLKEKGFNEKCYVNYSSNGVSLHFNYQTPSDGIPCPTLQMTMKWLREVHNLFIEIQYATAFIFQPHTTIYFRIFYMSLDYNTSGKDMLPDDYVREYYTSYEQACEAAIKYCLENLI